MALKNVMPDTASDKRERGPWHSAARNQKPAHIGWYEVMGVLSGEKNVVPRFWNGKYWCMVSEGGKVYSAIIQNRTWRGLAEKPE